MNKNHKVVLSIVIDIWVFDHRTSPVVTSVLEWTNGFPLSIFIFLANPFSIIQYDMYGVFEWDVGCIFFLGWAGWNFVCKIHSKISILLVFLNKVGLALAHPSYSVAPSMFILMHKLTNVSIHFYCVLFIDVDKIILIKNGTYSITIITTTILMGQQSPRSRLRSQQYLEQRWQLPGTRLQHLNVAS